MPKEEGILYSVENKDDRALRKKMSLIRTKVGRTLEWLKDNEESSGISHEKHPVCPECYAKGFMDGYRMRKREERHGLTFKETIEQVGETAWETAGLIREMSDAEFMEVFGLDPRAKDSVMEKFSFLEAAEKIRKYTGEFMEDIETDPEEPEGSGGTDLKYAAGPGSTSGEGV